MSIKDRLDSVWEGTPLPHFETIKNNQKTEVCVIGGGISGISVAYKLAKRGHKVTVVEAFSIGSGQTGRTTAHLTCQLEEQFQQLLKLHDEPTVRTFLDAHRSAIDLIEENIKEENIDCDFKRLNGYLFRGKNFSESKMKKEQDAGKKSGIELDYLEKTPLLNSDISCLRFPRQGQFDPMKYMAGLIKAMSKLGVNFYENTHVSHIETKDPENAVISTDSGYQIEARFLVVATDSPINNRFYIHTKQFAYRTYAMAFQVEGEVEEECLLWDTEDPYHYIRFVGDTLVVGCEDHRTGQDPQTDSFKNLEDWSRQNFSFIGEVTSKWSGQVFETTDQIGYIGKNPGTEKNVYITTGQSGIGMTSATIAAEIIPSLIETGTHPWAQVFDPSRPPVRGITEYVKENINVAFQYKDLVTGSEVENIRDIPEDSGSVIREGLTKSCVYHLSGDEFEKKSAFCTHLGGVVHWNDVEKTWDCPAHGSRFNTHGKVIEGPAIDGLSER
ncbi:MAG TPA: FAD-dependent oxidoreductase [Bacteriovoracaceae bacterium]|nr:FAD-dependent oxidoreductase [Bacteriovoracaceae bacterium]